jgi:hypothetical protein
MNEGWKCPVCGRGVAPSVAYCDHGAPLGALPGQPGQDDFPPFIPKWEFTGIPPDGPGVIIARGAG